MVVFALALLSTPLWLRQRVTIIDPFLTNFWMSKGAGLSPISAGFAQDSVLACAFLEVFAHLDFSIVGAVFSFFGFQFFHLFLFFISFFSIFFIFFTFSLLPLFIYFLDYLISWLLRANSPSWEVLSSTYSVFSMTSSSLEPASLSLPFSLSPSLESSDISLTTLFWPGGSISWDWVGSEIQSLPFLLPRKSFVLLVVLLYQLQLGWRGLSFSEFHP